MTKCRILSRFVAYFCLFLPFCLIMSIGIAFVRYKSNILLTGMFKKVVTPPI